MVPKQESKAKGKSVLYERREEGEQLGRLLITLSKDMCRQGGCPGISLSFPMYTKCSPFSHYIGISIMGEQIFLQKYLS